MKRVFDVMSVPGRNDDGSDTYWYVWDRSCPSVDAEEIGAGNEARNQALAVARKRNGERR